MNAGCRTLILAWGNPGRGDDGLGPAFARALASEELNGVSIQSDYQLQVEDAAELIDRQQVLFVDADRSGGEPFWLARLEPQSHGLSFSTHSVQPAALLALARDLFRAEPEAWILGIRGYDFDEFREELSVGARENLDRAVASVKSALEGGGLGELLSSAAMPSIIEDHEGVPCQKTNP